MKDLTNKKWEELSAQYDWIADMHGVPQSPVHHAEGDVAVHTQMVLKALESLKEYQELDETAKQILWVAALLHDVEKRSTTYTEPDGSIVSPGHAKKGAATARYILYSGFDVPFAVREQIVNLVRYHGLPLWLMHKPDPKKALLHASLRVNTMWLSILARADIYGRICNDQEEMLERIDFFKAYCVEQGCWGVPYPFPCDLSRYRYFATENGSPDYSPYNDTICDVIVISGLPGMGKDSYIHNHYKDWPVISLDAIRKQHKLQPDDKSANGWVAQQAKEQARIYLRAKRSFVWNATNVTLQMRSQLIELMTTYKAKVKIVYIEKPYKIWREQNGRRDEAVPQNIMNRLLRKLEVPCPSEAHTVAYIV